MLIRFTVDNNFFKQRFNMLASEKVARSHHVFAIIQNSL